MTSSKIKISFEITNCDFKVKKSPHVFYYLKSKNPIPFQNRFIVGRSMRSASTGICPNISKKEIYGNP